METNYILSSDEIFFDKNCINDENEIFYILGVKKNSYAGSIFSRLYDLYFDHSIQLKNEYKKFYRKEYLSFESFLFDKYNLSQSEIDRFSCCNLYFKHYSLIPGYGVNYILEDKRISEIFWKSVIKDENQRRIRHKQFINKFFNNI